MRAKVRGEDFSRNRVLIDIDECSIARVAKLTPLIYYIRVREVKELKLTRKRRGTEK